GVVGLATQGRLVVIDCIAQLALETQHICQIGINLSVVGVDIESLSEMGSSFIQSALFYQRFAETIFSNLVVRSVGEGLMPHCFTVSPRGGLRRIRARMFR